MIRRCACCDKLFAPIPQVPDQRYCSSLVCQRDRKRQWQRTKRQSDPDYRLNQRAAQQAWTQRHPDYWRNRRAQQHMHTRDVEPVKMDACDFPSGLYRITRHPSFPRGNDASWVVEITPMTLMRPRKMDGSREDVIDTPMVYP